jgi:hypothetical protein
MPVVDDFFADVEGFLVDVECDINNVYGSHDAGTKTTGLSKQNFFKRHE